MSMLEIFDDMSKDRLLYGEIDEESYKERILEALKPVVLAPLEEVPLFINDEDSSIRQVAAWRLKRGR